MFPGYLSGLQISRQIKIIKLGLEWSNESRRNIREIREILSKNPKTTKIIGNFDYTLKKRKRI